MRQQVRAVSVIWTLAAAFCLTAAYGAAVPWFQDVSAQKGLLSFGQLDVDRTLNNKYWGSTFADLDRDGKYDLFLSNHGNNPELYFMQPDGTYDYKDPLMRHADLHATAAADLNNDGYLEFLINTGGRNGRLVNGHSIVNVVNPDQTFFRRIGTTKYRVIAHRGRAMMFLDMNADGYLDLLLLNQRNVSATNRHIVYENLRNGQFRYRPGTGIEASDGHWGQIIDANNDGYPDVLVLKWSGIDLWLGTGNFEFRQGTHLIPEAAAGDRKMRLVRCVAEIDYDGDGDLDLILARGSSTRPERGAPADIILENRDGIFTSVRKVPGLEENRHHFHVTVGDFNNDGLMDMYFSVMTQYAAPRKPDWMYLNEGGGRFSVAPRHGTEATKADSDGDNANAFDYNLDGRIDLLVGSRNEAWKLYENQSDRGANHYLLLRVGEPRSRLAKRELYRRKALGALVKVSCGGRVFLQRVGSPGQSHSQSYADTLHFGLGECTWINSIEIRYPGKLTVTRTDVAVDQVLTMGLYFPCEGEMEGEDCNKPVILCKIDPCPENMSCEKHVLEGVATLICPL